MTANELRDLLGTAEFRQGLEELSSYLASIMQERPIVYLLAKCLWKKGCDYVLEDQRQDLFVNGRRIEFKFNYDRCQKRLAADLDKYRDNLKGMWELVEAGVLNKSWSVLAKIYEDMCVRMPRPDLFVWIICQRDLTRVSATDLSRIVMGREQLAYAAANPGDPDGNPLRVIDSLFDALQTCRRFSLVSHQIKTSGLFPSTYHFRICEFVSGSPSKSERP